MKRVCVITGTRAEYGLLKRDRQRGRAASGSVIHCGTGVEEINSAICKAMQGDFRQSIKNAKNPYEGENTSSEIVNIIKHYLQNSIDIKKKFYDLENR